MTTIVGFVNGDLTTLDINAEDVTAQDTTVDALVADSILFTPVLTPAQTLLQYHSAGTFTVNIAGDGVAGTPTYVANGNFGRYERIGNRVWISVILAWNALAGAAGSLICAGLPYTAASLGGGVNTNVAWDIKTNWGSVTNALASGAGKIPVARIGQGATSALLLTYDETSGANTPLPVAGTGSFYLNGFYEV